MLFQRLSTGKRNERLKLFNLAAGVATELDGQPSDLGKPLQTLIGGDLEPLLAMERETCR